MLSLVRSSAAAILLLATALFSYSAPADYRLTFTNGLVEVRGIPTATLKILETSNWSTPQWQGVLSVYAKQDANLFNQLPLPPIAGDYEIESQTLQFKPAFPFEPNVSYNAIFRPQNLPAGSGEPLTAQHTKTEAPPAPSTTITAIYPSTSTLPENLLKFYLHFSAPMSGGHVYDHIHLIDTANGKPVELPFLEIDEELWNPDMTRLTLFLDPGRIKRGVRPLEEIGPSFQAGKTYALTISNTWKDAKGAPLKSGFEKKFTVTPPDRVTPNPKLWKISPPTSATAAVQIQFEKSLDHAIAERRLSVIDSLSKRVAGAVEISDQERHWSFTPESPWKSGDYQIEVPTLIEDLAGNNIGKPFDLDLLEDKQLSGMDYVKLPFTVK